MLEEKSAKLIRELNLLITKYSSNDKVRNIIIDEFDKRNMRGGLAISILNEKRALSTLDINEDKDLILLYVFTNGMFSALTFKEDKDSPTLGTIDECLSLTPDKYFNPIEIERFNKYKENRKSKNKEPYVLHNMTKRADGHYSGSITSPDLAVMDGYNDILYAFEMQRDSHIDINGMERINTDKTKLKTITERLLSGAQFSDDIKFNLLQDGEDELYFNEKTGDLTIVSGNIYIFDGFHRMTSSVQAQKINPELNFIWGLVVCNFSQKKTQEFMTQINEQKPMKKEHIGNLDSSKMGNIVISIIQDSESEFGTTIRESDAELKFSGLVKKSLLATSIEEVYGSKLTNRINAKAIANHVSKVLDSIIELDMESFIIHPDVAKETSYINHKNMFAGYIALTERLYEVGNWEDKLESALDQVNFSIENPFWKDTGLLEVNMKKSTRNNIYKFFSKLV